MLEPVTALDDLAPIDQEADADLQAVLDEQPCVATAPRAGGATYKPGTRRVVAAVERAASEGSWWMRPDADFPKEATRMRAQHANLKVPGEDHIVGWPAATSGGFR